jgi:hypothetical protein
MSSQHLLLTVLKDLGYSSYMLNRMIRALSNCLVKYPDLNEDQFTAMCYGILMATVGHYEHSLSLESEIFKTFYLVAKERLATIDQWRQYFEP